MEELPFILAKAIPRKGVGMILNFSPKNDRYERERGWSLREEREFN